MITLIYHILLHKASVFGFDYHNLLRRSKQTHKNFNFLLTLLQGMEHVELAAGLDFHRYGQVQINHSRVNQHLFPLKYFIFGANTL